MANDIWVPYEDILEGDSVWSEIDEDQQARAILLATSSLITLTYNRVGTAPIIIRPCPERAACGCTFNPHMEPDGFWYNDCYHKGTCRPLSEVDIPGPVGFISKMLIDGDPVDLFSGDWRLDDGHLLVWQGDGPSPVPSYQNLNRPDTATGTWSITYSQSYPVSADGRLALTYLVLEFARALKPKGKCSLPRGVTQVTRNGVAFSIEAGLFPGGLTGVDQTDQYILKWAPAGSPTANAVVFDPSRRGPRRTNSVPRKAV